jgi:hypothetical protein
MLSAMKDGQRVGFKDKSMKELGENKRVGNITSWEKHISWARFKISKSGRMASLMKKSWRI